jgi:hypothetical protein
MAKTTELPNLCIKKKLVLNVVVFSVVVIGIVVVVVLGMVEM